MKFWTLGPNEFQRPIDILSCEKIDEIVSGVIDDGYKLQPTPVHRENPDDVPSCVWKSSEGTKIIAIISQTKADAEYIRKMRGEKYFGELPRSEVYRSARLDKIGAVATLPENSPDSARVWIPGLRVVMGTSINRDIPLEACTRIAEYLVANNMLPPHMS